MAPPIVKENVPAGRVSGAHIEQTAVDAGIPDMIHGDDLKPGLGRSGRRKSLTLEFARRPGVCEEELPRS